jgi:UDP-N-acetylglucosamine:LPS N-acetylglucosamine transferase
MGGMEFRLPVENWTPVPGVKWLVPGAWGLTRADVRNIDVAGLDFIDLLASVDAVVTKPGYGTFVEAACGGVPLLYVDRDDWPETPHFAAWLALHSRAARVSRKRLLQGDFIDLLQDLWRAPAPTPPTADGAAQVARWLAREFQLA